MGRQRLVSRGKSCPCRIKAKKGANPGYLLAMLDQCKLYSTVEAGKLSSDPVKELDLAQLSLVTCVDLAVPRRLSSQARVGDGGGITTWDGDPPSWGGDPLQPSSFAPLWNCHAFP